MKTWNQLESQCHTTFINAVVEYVAPEKPGKVKTLTLVTIMRDELILATATLAGEYTQSQAYRYWIRFLDTTNDADNLPADEMKKWKMNGDPKGALETKTQAGIFLGPVLVAETMIPGIIYPDAALEDFQISDEGWKLYAEGYTAARSLQLV